MYLYLLLLLVAAANANPFKSVFSWNKLEYNFPNESYREEALKSGKWIQEHNAPFGVNVWDNKMFLTVPRFKAGVLSTLNYIDLDRKGDPTVGLLNPYPNWESNDVTKSGAIVSLLRTRIDACERLWGVDTGIEDLAGNARRVGPTKLIAIDLKTDKIILQYPLKESHIKEESLFTNTIVDVDPNNCNDAYVYIADTEAYGLIVYSLAKNDSWRVANNYFYPDLFNGEFDNLGFNYQWHDGILAMMLTPPQVDGEKTMHFYSMTSVHQFRVPTSLLKNQTALEEPLSFKQFKVDGYRGANTQATIGVFDPDHDIIYYALLMKNGVACWDIHKRLSPYSFRTLVRDNNVLGTPVDIMFEPKTKKIYTLANKYPFLLRGKYDFSVSNFHVISASTDDLAAACKIRWHY